MSRVSSRPRGSAISAPAPAERHGPERIVSVRRRSKEFSARNADLGNFWTHALYIAEEKSVKVFVMRMVTYFQLGVSLRSYVSLSFIAFAGKFTAETQRTLRYAENIFKLGHHREAKWSSLKIDATA